MKKKSLLALLLACVLALALTACGGSSGGEAAEEETADYLGTYNICKIEMGPLTVSPAEFGYEECFMDLKDGGTMTFDSGAETEEVPYTVDGTAFSLVENGDTITGTLQDDVVALNMTAANLGGEGDQVAMVMYFAKAGSDAETRMKDEIAAVGTVEEQVEAMSVEELTQFMEEYGYLMGA